MSDRSRHGRLTTAACLVVLIGIVAHGMYPIARCADSCFIDYFAIHDSQTAHFEMPDARLNSWILAWVQHALLTNPSEVFDTNVFYPAQNTLAGSEHMLGVAFQMLPLQLFGGGAVLLHQATLMLSFALLALNMFFFVRWLSGSQWAALLAGAAAAFMPWRFSELGHLQLLNVQWLPLIWLLVGRLLTEPSKRRDALWLTLVATLQMLSSFYLAYLTLFSTGLLALVLWISARPSPAKLLRCAGAFALPTGLVALTGIPYLSRYSAYRYSESSTTGFASSLDLIASFLQPPLQLVADAEGIAPVAYHLPLVVLACALFAFGWWSSARQGPAPDVARIRALTTALLVACAASFTLMLGRSLEIGGETIRLPSHWLAQFVPGFSQMRAEFRWGIVIGLAGPALAGIGIAWLELRARSVTPPTRRRAALALCYAVTALGFALNIHWFRLPARDAWEDARDVLAAHAALADLEPGVMVEIPWRVHRIDTATNGSRYMLGSTLHWNPTLNGYTAYVPESYHFLQRVGQGLPNPTAIESLRRLTGLRWIVVHPERMSRSQQNVWANAEQQGDLQLKLATPRYRIYEVPTAPGSADWLPALRADTRSEKTLTGLSRAPLSAPATPPKLHVRVNRQMRYEHESGIPYLAMLTIRHDGDRTWPGLDIDPEGLVALRTRFLDADGELVHQVDSNLDSDIPPGRPVVARALIRPPARDGRYEVRFDLVQRSGDERIELGPDSTTLPIEVSKRPLRHGLKGTSD